MPFPSPVIRVLKNLQTLPFCCDYYYPQNSTHSNALGQTQNAAQNWTYNAHTPKPKLLQSFKKLQLCKITKQ
jgi:hypothetical protein